jgi:drug/metabolite transporter (DMT)-like permease
MEGQVDTSILGTVDPPLRPKQTMIYIYLEPVSAVIIAAVFGEVLYPSQTVGVLLTFVGVGLVSSH